LWKLWTIIFFLRDNDRRNGLLHFITWRRAKPWLVESIAYRVPNQQRDRLPFRLPGAFGGGEVKEKSKRAQRRWRGALGGHGGKPLPRSSFKAVHTTVY